MDKIEDYKADQRQRLLATRLAHEVQYLLRINHLVVECRCSYLRVELARTTSLSHEGERLLEMRF